MRAPLDLSRLVVETVAGVEVLAEDRGVRLVVETPGAVRVVGDAGRLRQALLILLDNALTYTPDDGSITVSVARQGGHARLRVGIAGRGSRRRIFRTSSSASTGPTRRAGAWVVAWGCLSGAGSLRRTAGASRPPTPLGAAPSSRSRFRSRRPNRGHNIIIRALPPST